MSIGEVRNIERPCFRCNRTIYLHPKIRKESDKTKLRAMNTPYVEGEAINYHEGCDLQPNKKYNYEPERTKGPDELYSWKKPNYDDKKDEKPKVQIISQELPKQFLKDVEEMKQDISDIKMLLQATIKLFDVSLQKNNKDGSSFLFQKASNMVDYSKDHEENEQQKAKAREEEEERIKIEQQKKQHAETDNVDQDDGVAPKESFETTSKTTKTTKKENPATE